MININKCKDIAKLLAAKSKKELGDQKLEIFNTTFNQIIDEYNEKYHFYSTAINLQALKSFNKWLPNVLEDKVLLTPIIVDKMVNEKDLYSLSLYQAIYAGSDLTSVEELYKHSELKSEHYQSGGGEHGLALIAGCYWIDQQNGITGTE
ncbi:hypothetical protein MIDIC_340024 [Alphaproteobacteria bacterium]